MHAVTLVDALKRMLKGRGMTYAAVAAGLGLSEASVKRMFSRRDFTLQRLEHVCRVTGVDFGELVHDASVGEAGITHLTVGQEEEIVSDPKLMLVALCAVGHWTLEQIVDTYDISQAECIRYLTRLDRRKIIALQPGNRIRPLISRTFSWLPDGPIQRYFRSRVESEYLSSKFDRQGELFLFVSGMLSRASTAELIARMRRVAGEFGELHGADRTLPCRSGMGQACC
jgi:transcriptional regulator with XRE-family HTH domain